MRRLPSHQSGVLLLEVLVAILIFALGLLAVLSLQGAAMREIGDARYRMDAAILADQLVGQMWADDRTNATLIANYDSVNAAAPGYAPWAAQVSQLLPNAIGANAPTVTVNATNQVTINIFWQAPEDTNRHQFGMITQLATP